MQAPKRRSCRFYNIRNKKRPRGCEKGMVCTFQCEEYWRRSKIKR